MGRTVSPVFDVPHGKTSGFSTALCSHPRAVLHCSVGVLACLDAFRVGYRAVPGLWGYQKSLITWDFDAFG